MEFHHIGVATQNLRKSIVIYQALGFKTGNLIFDPVQHVNICFAEESGHPLIELIEPVNDKSPVYLIIEKAGTSPYHLCYYSHDFINEISFLKANKFILVVKPVEAVAFEMKRICFCYNKDFGLIELIED